MLDVEESGLSVGDARLYSRANPDGTIALICQICTEWTEEKNLALDPVDGKRWDVCTDCYEMNEER